MTDRRTIYIVTEGEYSGYRVLAAYETEDAARDAVSAGFGEDYEELPLLSAGDIPRKVVVHHTTVRGDGVVDFSYTSDEWDFNVKADVDEFQAASNFHISGRDKDRVLKAAQDRAARLRAEREGIA